MDANGLGRLLNNAKELGIHIPVVCGIRPSHIEKIKNDNSWVNLFDYLKDELNKYAQKHNYVSAIEEINKCNTVSAPRYEDMAKIRDQLSAQSPMFVFLDNFNRIQKLKKSMGDHIDPVTAMAVALEYTLPKSTVIYDIEAEEKKLNKVYPMFKMADNYRFDKEQAKTVIEYVGMVDGQKSLKKSA
jgi:hypothetical protein